MEDTDLGRAGTGAVDWGGRGQWQPSSGIDEGKDEWARASLTTAGPTHLQVELIAGVAPIELRALDPEPSGLEGSRAPVAVADVPQHLLVAAHGAHTCHEKAGEQLRRRTAAAGACGAPDWPG